MSVKKDRILKWLSLGAGLILGSVLLFGINYYPVAVDFLARIPDQNQEKFLDMHTHVACLGPEVPVETDCFVSPDMRTSYKFSIYLKAFGMTQILFTSFSILLLFPIWSTVVVCDCKVRSTSRW